MTRMVLAAAAFAAIALPAHAQRLDTRRNNVESDAYHTKCGFNAHPELVLVYTRTGKAAAWKKAPDGAEPGDRTELNLVVAPGQGDWRHPDLVVLMISGYGDARLKPAAITRGRLSVDGGAAVMLDPVSSDGKFVLKLGPEGRETAHAMIDGSKRVDLDLLDDHDGVLRSYSWDTHRLSDAVETVAVVGWSCATP